MTQQPEPGDDGQVPQVVATYAGYLRSKTGAAPEVTVTGDTARLAVTVGDKSLVAAFEIRRGLWTLARAEVSRGDRARAFTSGKLADAVKALLAPPEPRAPASARERGGKP